MAPQPAIQVRNVWKRFGGRDAVAGVTLEVARGTCCVVFGPNGSGKTTLLRMLATVSEPSEGELSVAGCALPREAGRARARLGVVLDHHLLPRDFTLEEGLAYYADLYGVARSRARAHALCERLGLAHRLRDPLRTFSRGMGQRAGLVRALLHEPEVLLLDEPFTALDPEGCSVVEQVVTETARAGGTVLLVTHDLDRGAAVADTAVLLERGRKVAEGPHAEVAARAVRNSLVAVGAHQP